MGGRITRDSIPGYGLGRAGPRARRDGKSLENRCLTAAAVEG